MVSVGTDINWKITAIFNEKNTAADAKKMIDGIAVMAKNAKGLSPEIIEFIEKLEFKLNGNRVELTGAIEI